MLVTVNAHVVVMTFQRFACIIQFFRKTYVFLNVINASLFAVQFDILVSKFYIMHIFSDFFCHLVFNAYKIFVNQSKVFDFFVEDAFY